MSPLSDTWLINTKKGCKTFLVGREDAENLAFRSKELAQKYIENWEKHKGLSERYDGR